MQSILHVDKHMNRLSCPHLSVNWLFERSTWGRQARGGTGNHGLVERQQQIRGQLKSQHKNCVGAVEPDAHRYEVSTTQTATGF